MRTEIILLTFLSLFLNKDEQQAAIGALAVAGANGGTTGRAFALAGQFVGSADLRMHFHEVFLNSLLRPFKVLRRYNQTAFITAAAFLAACIGTDGAGNTGVDEHCVQFTQPIEITLPDHDLVLNRLLHEPFLFLLCFLELLGEEEDCAAISAFLDVREVLGFASRTYLVPVHSA